MKRQKKVNKERKKDYHNCHKSEKNILSSIRTTVLYSRADTIAVVEDVVRVPGRLDPQEPGVARPPVSLGKVYGLTAGCVPVLELRELLHPGV